MRNHLLSSSHHECHHQHHGPQLSSRPALSKLQRRKARDQKSLKQMATNLVVAAGDEGGVVAAGVGIAARRLKRHHVLRMTTACQGMAATLMRSGTSVAATVPVLVVSRPTFVHMLRGRMSSAADWMMNQRT